MTHFIGTAGWSIPGKDASAFKNEGHTLERYASRFRAVEVNSSFYRPHRPSTWARWADLVPEDFRFAVKIPKTVTHERKLVDCEDQLVKFMSEVCHLGPKLAVLLVQLPPKLSFTPDIAADFLAMLASLTKVQIVFEPRHPSWFGASAEALLAQNHVARAAADPSPVPAGSRPGGWRGLSYWRLHGSPVVYHSPYGHERIDEYGQFLRAEQDCGRSSWCIFDNTASFAAVGDALALQRAMDAARLPH